jgi:hypothetical protein
LCQGLIFEVDTSTEIVAPFAGFVIFMLVLCIAFNVIVVLRKLLKQELHSIVLPSAIKMDKKLSKQTMMEICQLHSLYQLQKLGELEVDQQALLRIAYESSENPFLIENDNIKKFLKREMDVWSNPALARDRMESKVEGIQAASGEDPDWAKHTQDFLLKCPSSDGSLQVASSPLQI